MNEEEYNKFITYYYQSGTPELAAESLEYFIVSELMKHSRTHPIDIPLASYFYAKIAENNPSIIEEYESVFRRVPHQGKIFILKVMEWLHDENAKGFLIRTLRDKTYKEERNAIEETLRVLSTTKKLDIYQNNISTSVDLDLLWTEFLITGKKESVLRIIDVLELTDRVREKLSDWLKLKQSKKFLADWRRKRKLKKLDSIGILLDNSLRNILSTQDLDCFIAMEGCNANSEIFREGQNQLPFRLTQEDINHIGLKAVAKWSLCSNASQHPIVLETINSEASKRAGHCRLALLEISALTALSSDDLETAFNTLYESLDPYPSVRRKQFDYAKTKFKQLLALPNEELIEESHSNINIEEFVISAIDATKKASTYRSKVLLEEVNFKHPPRTTISWKLEHVKPDKFRVFQHAGEDYDEWITLGTEHFRAPIYARRKGPDSLMKEDIGLNNSLLVNRYFKPMREIYPNSFSTYQSERNEYYQIVYKGTTAEQFENELFPEDNESDVGELDRVHIWIEKDTQYIVRVDLLFNLIIDEESSPFRARYVQLFANYNENIVIVPPAFEVVKMQ